MEFGVHVGKGAREPKLWKGNQLPQAREWKMQPSGWTRASRALHNSAILAACAAGKRLRFNLGRYSPRIWPRPRRRAPGRWCILFLFWCATLLGVLISLDIKFYSLVHLCSLFLSPAHTHAEDRKGAFFMLIELVHYLQVHGDCYLLFRMPNRESAPGHTLSNQYAAPPLPLQPHTARARRYIPLGSTKSGDHLASLLYDRYRLSTRISPQKPKRASWAPQMEK